MPVPAGLFGQAIRISGTVQDQSGASIPNATVLLQKGGETRTALTSTDGTFSFERIASGTYEVKMDQPGFKTATARIVVGNRAPRPVEFKLQIATLQQELTVAGDDGLTVNTQTGNNRPVERRRTDRRLIKVRARTRRGRSFMAL